MALMYTHREIADAFDADGLSAAEACFLNGYLDSK